MKIKISSDKVSLTIDTIKPVYIDAENNGYIRKYRLNGNGIIIKEGMEEIE